MTAAPLAHQRLAQRRSRARRSTAVAVLATVLVATAVGYGVVGSPAWPRIRDTFLDPTVAWSSLPAIATGLWLTIRVLVVAAVGSVVLGLAVALLRGLPGPAFSPLRAAAVGYVELLRSVPPLIALYLIGFGVPALHLKGVPTDVTVLATIALVLVHAAYVAETFRAAMGSVHPVQRAAARSLGLNPLQTMCLVLLPQAAGRIGPPLLTNLVALQKDCALISVIGVLDAVRAAKDEMAGPFTFTPYVVAGLLFVLLAIPTARLADAVAARSARRRSAP